MATYQLGTYLENFLESVAGLPQDLRRNFALMADLDSRSQEATEKIKRLQTNYLNGIRRMHREGRKEPPEATLDEIRTLYKTCLEFSDEKIALAVQTYRIIDKYIQRLDGDLKKFEAELSEAQQAQLKAGLEASGQFPTPDDSKKSRKRKQMSGSLNVDEIEVAKNDKKGKGVGGRTKEKLRPHSVDLDMPVDPNEPTYCICRRVSFGNMVGCDNPDCPIEWFHFECVGLTASPKGKWLCSECLEAKKKRS
mmetsp:Transcript_29775/g.41115  ORF Transcript_29775/g.41115 Transcript_29775/m.41115 type:complete len:251 (+) Transcript_29775:208-960(+)|eukprot:CAMPEP_0201480928 /NCGR_PEP_ID=MMETSP0151_2-20130828/5287_1 /ASSEMBLY_ACC=CAM_ASM_000257 /TAXON_ID=200890 /ORGANISM="Paramoeba atlantica, Strain 621/1 / CCAP 1560/9" /LENGTH=250 /DNA_ID=CAMNT_0047862921 /DNA_START=202 /DNA_END=954 /DNA_ORIENTATION=-